MIFPLLEKVSLILKQSGKKVWNPISWCYLHIWWGHQRKSKPQRQSWMWAKDPRRGRCSTMLCVCSEQSGFFLLPALSRRENFVRQSYRLGEFLSILQPYFSKLICSVIPWLVILTVSMCMCVCVCILTTDSPPLLTVSTCCAPLSLAFVT